MARGAGLKDFHDLRHHGATMALNAGFTTPILMQLGGWKTEKMVRRYAAVTDQTLSGKEVLRVSILGQRVVESADGHRPDVFRDGDSMQ